MLGSLRQAVLRWRLRGRGIEIGAHDLPIPGLRPIYVDRFTVFAGVPCRADVVADAGRLPFADAALDYVASSHVLEHLPNPVQALVEWRRVVRRGGWLYLVAPDRRYTFDRPRPLTPVEHLLDDFEAGVNARDTTHFEDYILKRELAGSRLAAGRAPEEWLRLRQETLEELHRTAAAGGLPGLHYHVFEPSNLAELFERLHQWEVVRLEERYPPARADGILVLARAAW